MQSAVVKTIDSIRSQFVAGARPIEASAVRLAWRAHSGMMDLGGDPRVRVYLSAVSAGQHVSFSKTSVVCMSEWHACMWWHEGACMWRCMQVESRGAARDAVQVARQKEAQRTLAAHAAKLEAAQHRARGDLVSPDAPTVGTVMECFDDHHEFLAEGLREFVCGVCGEKHPVSAFPRRRIARPYPVGCDVAEFGPGGPYRKFVTATDKQRAELPEYEFAYAESFDSVLTTGAAPGRTSPVLIERLGLTTDDQLLHQYKVAAGKARLPQASGS
jgi:hypothetical protein